MDELPDQLLEINGGEARCAAGWLSDGKGYYTNYSMEGCGESEGT